MPAPVVVARDDPAERVAAFRERFERVARRAVDARGRFSVALTGGSTPERFYPSLRGADVPWGATHLFWGDERLVPPDDAASNYGLALRTFLADVPVPERQRHRIEGERRDAATIVERASRALRDAAGAPARFDVVHLGVGGDGHVASLFPGHPVLDDPGARVRLVVDAPKAPPRRVTVTLPVLTGAREVWLFADARKAPVLREAFRDPAPALPVARVVRGARGRVVWFTDEAAAAALPRE